MKTTEPSDYRELYQVAPGKFQTILAPYPHLINPLQTEPRRPTRRPRQPDRPLEGGPAPSGRGKATGTRDEASAGDHDEAARIGGKGGEFEGVGDEVGYVPPRLVGSHVGLTLLGSQLRRPTASKGNPSWK